MTTADVDATVQRAVQLISERAARYYPCRTGETIETRLVGTQPRRFSVLCELEVSSGAWRRTLLAKITRDGAQFEEAAEREAIQSYIVAGPDPKGAEHAALVKVGRYFDELSDPRFFSIPVLDSLLEDQVLVLEKVPALSLTSLLRSCASPVTLPETRRRMIEAVANAGAWLRCFHRMPEQKGGRDRGTTRIDFVNAIQSVGSYLGRQKRGRRFFARVEKRMTEAADRLLPEQLPSSALHDDFAPRNILIDGQGRIGVIDMLLEWRGCVWEDVAQFVVSVQTNKLRTLSCGVLFPPRILREIEEAFVGGYFESESVPWPALRLYQAQIALTKWAALIYGQHQQPNRRSAARIAISSRQFEAYIDGRLQLMEQSVVESTSVAPAACPTAKGGR